MSIKTAQFINTTHLPIELSGLIQVLPGLNKLNSIVVMPNEECTINSITGEWFLTTYFNESKYKVMWAKNKMETIGSIGKFRKEPCIQGNYSWMDTDIFNITHSNNVFKFSYVI